MNSATSFPNLPLLRGTFRHVLKMSGRSNATLFPLCYQSNKLCRSRKQSCIPSELKVCVCVWDRYAFCRTLLNLFLFSLQLGIFFLFFFFFFFTDFIQICIYLIKHSKHSRHIFSQTSKSHFLQHGAQTLHVDLFPFLYCAAASKDFFKVGTLTETKPFQIQQIQRGKKS